MAKRSTKPTSRRNAPTKRRTRAQTSRTRRRKPFVLRWYHLVASCIGTFALGYLVAFGQATNYVATVVGLR